jgi:hypothetical protein
MAVAATTSTRVPSVVIAIATWPFGRGTGRPTAAGPPAATPARRRRTRPGRVSRPGRRSPWRTRRRRRSSPSGSARGGARRAPRWEPATGTPRESVRPRQRGCPTAAPRRPPAPSRSGSPPRSRSLRQRGWRTGSQRGGEARLTLLCGFGRRFPVPSLTSRAPACCLAARPRPTTATRRADILRFHSVEQPGDAGDATVLESAREESQLAANDKHAPRRHAAGRPKTAKWDAGTRSTPSLFGWRGKGGRCRAAGGWRRSSDGQGARRSSNEGPEPRPSDGVP